MDPKHIIACPSASDSSSSMQSQRLFKRAERRLDDHQRPENTCISTEVANIYNADRHDKQRALQKPLKNRSDVPSSDFLSVQDFLLSQADNSGTPSPTYEEEENIPICVSPPWFPIRKEKTVAADEDEEDRLSCSTGLSVQEDHTAVAKEPKTTALCELDANSSQKICKNLLNLSEYFSFSNHGPTPSNTSTSASTHKALSIDLPIKEETLLDSDPSVACTSVEFENLEYDRLKLGYTYEASEVRDIKQAHGNETNTLFGESESIRKTSPTNHRWEMEAKVCEDWGEDDSFLANYDTEMSLSSDEHKQSDTSDVKPIMPLENPQESIHLILKDIPMSEWETIMDVPAVSNSKTEKSDNPTVKLEVMKKIEANLPEGIPDWESQGIAFGTASNKPIEVSEEKAAKLLADVEVDTQFQEEIALSQCPIKGVPEAISEVGFRTASNKPIEVSEEMKKRGAMLLADVASLSQLAECSPLDPLSLSKRVSTVDECRDQDTVTPFKRRFAPMSASTSTPLSNRNINLVEEYRGGDDVSPVCMPPQKAPRLGLSRSRY